MQDYSLIFHLHVCQAQLPARLTRLQQAVPRLVLPFTGAQNRLCLYSAPNVPGYSSLSQPALHHDILHAPPDSCPSFHHHQCIMSGAVMDAEAAILISILGRLAQASLMPKSWYPDARHIRDYTYSLLPQCLSTGLLALPHVTRRSSQKPNTLPNGMQGLEGAVGLKALVVSFNELSSMEGLSSLTRLTCLDLSFNVIPRMQGLKVAQHMAPVLLLFTFASFRTVRWHLRVDLSVVCHRTLWCDSRLWRRMSCDACHVLSCHVMSCQDMSCQIPAPHAST